MIHHSRVGKRDIVPVGNDDMVLQMDAHDFQRVIQGLGDGIILAGGQRKSAGVVMRDDHGAGLHLQCLLDYLPGVDVDRIDNPAAHLTAADDGALVIQAQHQHNLVLLIGKARDQILSGIPGGCDLTDLIGFGYGAFLHDLRQKRQQNRRVLPHPGDLHQIFRSGMDLALEVPSTLRRLDVQVVSGDLNISGVSLDQLDFQSTSGDLTVRHGSLGALYMRSLSGDVYARLNELDSFDAKLASGDADIKCIYGGEFSAETQSGDIDAEFGETITSFFAKATSGDVSVKLPRNLRIAPNLSSLSGSIDTGIPSDPDGLPVTVRTISGDIKLRRK